MRTKIISFLSEVKRKNITQIELVNKNGLQFDYFVTAGLETSKGIAGVKNNVFLLDARFFGRLRQVYIYYRKHKHNVNHIEIFGGGRFGFLYAILAKLFGFKILLVERGVMNEYLDSKNRFTLLRFSSYVQYKVADICWYKEHYMEPHLKRLDVKNLNFIPNGIGHHNFEKKHLDLDSRPIDYLWVNRIIPLRHIDWVIRIAKQPQFADKKFAIFGFLDDSYALKKKEEILSMELSNVEIYDYSDNVISEYQGAKYFLLPADYVFGNNSLLESMASGVVPIITDVHGSNNLVQPGFNGIITDNTFEAFQNGMESTLKNENTKWNELSAASISTVKTKYSLKSFKEKLNLLYEKVEKL